MYRVYLNGRYLADFANIGHIERWRNRGSLRDISWLPGDTLDVVHEETGEVIISVVGGVVIHDTFEKHKGELSQPPQEGVCICDFSRGNWGCTCGAFQREAALKCTPLGDSSDCEDDDPISDAYLYNNDDIPF